MERAPRARFFCSYPRVAISVPALAAPAIEAISTSISYGDCGYFSYGFVRKLTQGVAGLFIVLFVLTELNFDPGENRKLIPVSSMMDLVIEAWAGSPWLRLHVILVLGCVFVMIFGRLDTGFDISISDGFLCARELIDKSGQIRSECGNGRKQGTSALLIPSMVRLDSDDVESRSGPNCLDHEYHDVKKIEIIAQLAIQDSKARSSNHVLHIVIFVVIMLRWLKRKLQRLVYDPGGKKELINVTCKLLRLLSNKKLYLKMFYQELNSNFNGLCYGDYSSVGVLMGVYWTMVNSAILLEPVGLELLLFWKHAKGLNMLYFKLISFCLSRIMLVLVVYLKSAMFISSLPEWFAWALCMSRELISSSPWFSSGFELICCVKLCLLNKFPSQTSM